MKIRAAGAAWPALILAAMLTLSGPIRAQTMVAATAVPPAATSARTAAVPVFVTTHRYGFDLRQGSDVISVRWWAPDIIEVHLLPDAHASADTLVLDPHMPFMHFAPQVRSDAAGEVLQTSPAMQVRWQQADDRLSIRDAQGHTLLRVDDLAALRDGRIALQSNPADALYGLGGYSKSNPSAAGLLRAGQWTVKAGMQGHPGAPWLWSSAGWGVLVDTLGAQVHIGDGHIAWTDMSKPDTHFFVIAGAPDALFAGLRTLSGAAPLFPKWSLGFINSQWGIDQRELLHIVRKYRALDIPLDAFALDFDWKAWGQNDYGEFRWNTKKFPGGPDGSLKKQLDALGVHLIGIQKPRIGVHTIEGQYASEHDFWFPGLKAEPDYFSHKLVQDLDFDNPAVRAWFFNPALRHSFATGIVGWWNDEADTTPDDTQFMNMQRAEYDGQRKYFPDTRVFSLNRDFYLGAQRYAYALWSGDIDTGFASMAAQRERMLSAINAGAMWWGMDGGGFQGHPSPQNYARWIQFDAFCPIFRVHGTHDQRRQPWVYGPTAEAAAVAAMRMRYQLLPYIYSYAWQDHSAGIGVVRPLAMAFPDDAAVRNDISAWMFGDWLLVAPVMEQGQTAKTIQLPPGTWTEWTTGKVYAGGQAVTLPVDAKTWSDIPLFIRAGAIIPMQPVMEYVGQHPVTQVSVQVFPAATPSTFEYYDDNGSNYAYEQGDYFLQRIGAQRVAQGVRLSLAPAQGHYQPALRTFLFAVHGIAARAVQAAGTPLAQHASLAALQAGAAPAWATGHDRYGPVTWLKLRAGFGQYLLLESR
ncbi:glycoside hydrolase family 31 protein [Metallibacterium scheffleri]